jgi:hypothetical protein
VACTFDCRVNGEPMFMVLRRNKVCSLCDWFAVLNLVGDTTCKWIYIFVVCLPWTQKIVLFPTSRMWILLFFHAHRTSEYLMVSRVSSCLLLSHVVGY